MLDFYKMKILMCRVVKVIHLEKINMKRVPKKAK